MIHNIGQKSARRRRQFGNLEHLERRELLSTTSLQKYGVELGQVNVRIAELGKVSAAVPSAQKVQGKLAALSQQKLTLKSAIHAVQVRRIDAQMQRRFQAETKGHHGNAMTPADDVTITDFAPIASELPNTEGATFYSPQQIQTAYGLNTEYNALNLASEGKGVTIAIVDAYYDQYITSDLNTFSTYWGLPKLDGVGNDPTFTVHNMQTVNSQNFRTVNINGTPTQIDTAANFGWDGEQALDVESAHSIAPYANILLVEASSNSNANLFQGAGSAESYAASQPGVVVVSNSFGGSESSTEANLDQWFTTPTGHSNVAFFASTGDSGGASTYVQGTRTRNIGGVEYPSASPNVVAVGGTSLYLSSVKGRYGLETAWGRNISTSLQEGSSGGVSADEPVPSYQSGILSYAKRAVPDISMVADEDTGNAVIDSDFFGEGIVPGETYFWQYGGTSLSSPQIAAESAIADALRLQNGLLPLTSNQLLTKVYNAYNSSSTYAADFHDVTSGQTGASISAGVGYDLATGVGTPIAPKYIALLSSP